MIGPYGVVSAVVDRINAALPAKVAEVRERYGLTPYDLPEPTQAVPYVPDISTLGEFPAVFVSYQDAQQEDSTITTPEAGALSEFYVFVYEVELYLICRGDSYADTERQTQMMEGAAREVVLQRKDISPESLADGESIVVNAVKVRSSPSDVVDDGSSRFVGAVVITFPVKADEAVDSPFASAGNVETTAVHPAFQ